jgi:tight adherence protein C
VKAQGFWYLTLVLSLMCALGGFLILKLARRTTRADVRIRSLGRLGRRTIIEDESSSSPALHRLLRKVGRSVLASGLLSRSTITDLEETITANNAAGGHQLALFVGVKVVLFFGLPLLAWLLVSITNLHIPVVLAMLVFAVVGLLLPDYIVRRNRKKYLETVDKGMPAALDLLIMCAEAGLSLEAALERVAVDGHAAVPATANEFRITANEMKILSDRRQALVNIGTRTKLDSAMRLGGALAQSLKYGTPLIQALRVLAAEMRQMEMTRFEERAARIPVLLTIPMIVFILPCIFVVVGGPAAIRVMQTFFHR